MLQLILLPVLPVPVTFPPPTTTTVKLLPEEVVEEPVHVELGPLPKLKFTVVLHVSVTGLALTHRTTALPRAVPAGGVTTSVTERVAGPFPEDLVITS